MQKSRITKGEKRLIGVTVCGIALLFSTALWHYRDVDPVLDIPKPIMPSPNAFAFYVKAGKSHESLQMATPASGVIEQAVDMRPQSSKPSRQLTRLPTPTAKDIWVKTNTPTLKLLRQGFVYRYRQPLACADLTPLPFLAHYRGLTRLLAVESQARAERGDWAGASRSALDILHLGNDMPRGGALIGSLVGCAINSNGRREFRDILPHLDAAASRIAAATIEKLEAGRVPFAEVMQEEKWSGQVWRHEMMRKAGWRTAILKNSLMSTGNPAVTDPIDLKTRMRLAMCSKRRVMNNYVRYMDALIAQARKPSALRQPVPVPDDPINQITLLDFERTGWNMARDETGNAVLELQLALRAFKLEHGVFPESLNSLTPSYLKKIPRDPFGSGEALHYRKTGKSYLLYSIGPDGRDDGGKAIDVPSRARSSSTTRYLIQPDSKGDYVAGINR